MTAIEGIFGLIASVFAILTGLFLAARYIGRKIDQWIEVEIENSSVIKTLSSRILRLEKVIGPPDDNTGN